jgi:hypothetical protein
MSLYHSTASCLSMRTPGRAMVFEPSPLVQPWSREVPTRSGHQAPGTLPRRRTRCF